MRLTANEFLFGVWTDELPPIEGFHCFDPNRNDGADCTLDTFEHFKDAVDTLLLEYGWNPDLRMTIERQGPKDDTKNAIFYDLPDDETLKTWYQERLATKLPEDEDAE